MINLKPKARYFLFIAFSFVFCTIFGTLSHELGHWSAAKLMGFDAEMNYRSSTYDDSQRLDKLYKLYSKKIEAENANEPFLEEEQYQELKEEAEQDDFYITLGGPLQTIIFGTFGFLWLIYRRRKRHKERLNLGDYAAIFLSLFWLREVFNPIVSIGQALYLGGSQYFGGDEYVLAHLLDWPDGSIAIPLGLIGLAISYYVIYKVIPKSKRSTFIDAGLLGGILGYVLWMKVIGSYILP
jgi:hypothetical protein